MIFLTFPESGLSLGTAIQVAWIEEAARRQAPGGVHYCTESTYRNPNIRYMLGQGALCNELFHRLLSPRAWKYWQARCSIAAGVWPLGYDYQDTHNPGMSVEEFRQGLAGSLMVSRRYNWIYSHNSREQLLGRKLEVYTNGVDVRPYLAVLAERQVITVPKYAALADEIRALRLRDYSADLGVTPWISLVGPADTPSVRLVRADELAQPASRAKRLGEVYALGALDVARGERARGAEERAVVAERAVLVYRDARVGKLSLFYLGYLRLA